MNKDIAEPIHIGSFDTYNAITGTLNKDLSPYWDRMGIVYVLGDYALHYSKGAILEIGMGESTVYLTKLAEKYNRQAFFCDLQQSVVLNALTVPGYFRENKSIIKKGEIGYVNRDCVIYIGHSDAFFEEIQIPPLALAFVDGEHTYEQAKKDFENILPLMVKDGLIFLHDTYPPSEEYLHEARCGKVYKLRQELEKRSDLDIFTFLKGAMEVGLTICRKKGENFPEYQQ